MSKRTLGRYRLFTCPVCNWVERRFCNTRFCQTCRGDVYPISREDPAGVVETATAWGIREGMPRNKGRVTRVLAAAEPWLWWGHILAMAEAKDLTCNDLTVTRAKDLKPGIYMEVTCPESDLCWRVVKLQAVTYARVDLALSLMGAPDAAP